MILKFCRSEELCGTCHNSCKKIYIFNTVNEINHKKTFPHELNKQLQLFRRFLINLKNWYYNVELEKRRHDFLVKLLFFFVYLVIFGFHVYLLLIDPTCHSCMVNRWFSACQSIVCEFHHFERIHKKIFQNNYNPILKQTHLFSWCKISV